MEGLDPSQVAGSLSLDQARQQGEKGERSWPCSSLGKGMGGRAWRHAFDAADLLSSNEPVI